MKNEDKANQPKAYISEDAIYAEEIRERKAAIKKSVVRFVIVFLFMGFFVLSIAMSRGWGKTTKETYINLNDSFTVPSVIGFMVWLIIRVSSEGAFDALGFIGGVVGRTLMPFGRNKLHKETYAEYKERKAENRSQPSARTGWSTSRCLLLSSAIYFAVSLVFLWLWYAA